MLSSLLQSRKFWLSVVSLAGVLLAHYSGLPAEVQAAIVAVFSTLVLAIAHEDNGRQITVDADTLAELLGDATLADEPDNAERAGK